MEQSIFFSLHTLSCVIAVKYGGVPERIAAALLATAAIVSTAIVGSQITMFSELELGLFIVDLVLFLTLLGLALSADRYWPMWLAALQLVSVWAHPAFAFSQSKMAYAYAVTSIFWTYPIQLILVIGAVRHHKRTQISG
jgi:hypothetical protein